MTRAFILAAFLFLGTWTFLRLALRPSGHGSPFRRAMWPVLYTALVLGIGASFVLGFSFDWVAYYTLESGLVESLTFWLQTLAGLSFGVVAWRSRKGRLNLLAVAGMVICFGIAGEEIAWGQHVFLFDPPDFVEVRNRQGELTIHNLSVGESSLGPWLQTLGPLTLFIAFLLVQLRFPTFARARTGTRFHPHVAVLLLLMGGFLAVSSWPHARDVPPELPISRILFEMFRGHSSPQSELSECCFAGFLLVAAVALFHVSGRDGTVGGEAA